MDIFSFVVIHIIIPCLGLAYFLLIRSKMLRKEVSNPPIIEFFILFTSYGGLLLVVLTHLFWQWSGMATLGALYLVLLAPVIMFIMLLRVRKKIKISGYHNTAYIMCILYFIIVPILLGITFLSNI